MVRPDGHTVYMAQTSADLPPVVGNAEERTVVVAVDATDQERSDREATQAMGLVADMQVTLARLQGLPDVDCVTNVHQNLAIQAEVGRITREMGPAVEAVAVNQQLHAAMAQNRELQKGHDSAVD